jgi:excisionase family DNA binding protein
MTVKDFAERVEISLSLAYALIAEGRVPHRRIGQRGRRGVIRITEDDLHAFLENSKPERVGGGA